MGMSSGKARQLIGDFNKAHVKKRSLVLAYFSHIAYHSLARTKKVLERDGALRVSTFDSRGTQAFLAEFDDFAVLSFRGTEYSTTRDIISDLMCWRTKYHGIKAHAGFVKALREVSKDVITALYKIKDKPVYFTGHSLGGALATLLALEYNPTCICTFGSPRVSGGHKFEYHFKYINEHRVVIQGDIVPHLPPRIPFFWYKHIGYPTGVKSDESRLSVFKTHSMFNYMWGTVEYLKDNEHSICEH